MYIRLVIVILTKYFYILMLCVPIWPKPIDIDHKGHSFLPYIDIMWDMLSNLNEISVKMSTFLYKLHSTVSVYMYSAEYGRIIHQNDQQSTRNMLVILRW